MFVRSFARSSSLFLNLHATFLTTANQRTSSSIRIFPFLQPLHIRHPLYLPTLFYVFELVLFLQLSLRSRLTLHAFTHGLLLILFLFFLIRSCGRSLLGLFPPLWTCPSLVVLSFYCLGAPIVVDLDAKWPVRCPRNYTPHRLEAKSMSSIDLNSMS